MREENATGVAGMARFAKRWIANIAFVTIGLYAVPVYLLVCFRTLPYYATKWCALIDRVCGGGAYDQDGLTKMLAFVLTMEVFVVFGRNLFAGRSVRREWRIAANAVSIAALSVPFVLSMMVAWELARYIAVMGVTPRRIVGVRFTLLFMAVPVFCAVRWIAGSVPKRRLVLFGAASLCAAFALFFSIDAAARRFVDTHPRPEVCGPNRVDVPAKPEAPTDYGPKDVFRFFRDYSSTENG